MIDKIITYNGSKYQVVSSGITKNGDMYLVVKPYAIKSINPELLLNELMNNDNPYKAIYEWWIKEKANVQLWNKHIYSPNDEDNIKAIRDMFELDKRLPIDVINVLNETITNDIWRNKIFTLKTLRKKRGNIQYFDIILNTLKLRIVKEQKNIGNTASEIRQENDIII